MTTSIPMMQTNIQPNVPHIFFHHSTLKKRSLRMLFGFPKSGGRFNQKWKQKILKDLKMNEVVFNFKHEFEGREVQTLLEKTFSLNSFQICRLNKIETFFTYGRTWEDVLEMILEGVI